MGKKNRVHRRRLNSQKPNAAGFRDNSKQLENQSQAYHCSLPSRSISGSEGGIGQSDGSEGGIGQSDGSVGVIGQSDGSVGGLGQSYESQNLKNQEVVSSVLSKFRDLNVDENSEQVHEQIDPMILNLINQIKDLERQVKERKEWAQKTVMQVERKVSNDLAELQMLRMEREEAQRLKKGKQASKETATERVTHLESALQEAMSHLDHKKLKVKSLENENAEIRAQIEAYKLNASKSETIRLEAVKRGEKSLKKLGALEKEKNKLREDIAAEKKKLKDLQQKQVEVEAAEKEAEAKWRQEQRAKEQALARLEEEWCLKEAAEATNKKKLEALRLRIEIDFQRKNDDLQRLKQDLTRLKASSELPEGNVARRLHDLARLEDSSKKDVSGNRKCLICMKGEVSVVLLPCAHQVLCAQCNDNYGKKGTAMCPCCRVPIEQRIRVFGATT